MSETRLSQNVGLYCKIKKRRIECQVLVISGNIGVGEENSEIYFRSRENSGDERNVLRVYHQHKRESGVHRDLNL